MKWFASWVLYLLGDAVSRVLNVIPDDWERVGWRTYQIYNRLMAWSSDIQGESDNGPWELVKRP